MEEKKRIVPKDKNDTDIVERTLVVDKLPTEDVRVVEDKGVRYNLITVSEALTELLNKE